MEGKHIATVPTACRFPAACAVGTYRGNVILASAGGAEGKEAWLWWAVSDASHQPVRLGAHQAYVTALAFSHADHLPRPLLCSASRDALSLWQLDSTHTKPTNGGPLTVSLTPSGGQVRYVVFSQTSRHLAVCQGLVVLVFLTENLGLDTTLVGHSAPVTCATFAPPSHPLTALTASEDRTFKVWDLEQSSLLYQSPVVSSSPFTAMAVNPQGGTMSIGTADGKLRVYDMAPGYKCLQDADVGMGVDHREMGTEAAQSQGVRVIQSVSPWQQQPSLHMTEPTTSAVDAGPGILGIHYWCESSQPHTKEPFCLLESLLEPPSLLLVTHMGLLRLNTNTLELRDSLQFREPVLSTAGGGSLHTIPAVGICDFAFNHIDRELYCALGSMFEGSVSVLAVRVNKEAVEADGRGGPLISVLSDAPLAPNSPLRAELVLKTPSAATGGGKRKKDTPVGARGRVSTDKPLTFRKQVKSSGYAQAPRMKMFTSKTLASGQMPVRCGKPQTTSQPRREESYPLASGPPTHLYHHTKLCDRPAPISCASFSSDGRYLSCASSDQAAYILKIPPKTGGTHAFVGHDGGLYSSCWSLDSQWLLTSSTDRTARVWSPGLTDPLLTISSSEHNFRTQGEVTGRANPAFPKDVTDAQFYYMDKFILLTCSNSLHLYKYHIDTSRPDDIRRYQTNSRYKLVKALPLETAQSITAMSCVNEFHSYIVLVAGSNKSVEVFDMNVGHSIRSMTGVHSRPVTCIAQSKGSRYISHSPMAYNLFLTSALTDGIKLWDLRTNRCVSRFSSHHCRSVPVSATFSPCARFIATGSEDRSAYMYSLDSPSPIHRLSGHSDVVTTVTYHPLKAMLATCTADGQVNLFTEEIVR